MLIKIPGREEIINTKQIENAKVILEKSIIIYFKGKRTRYLEFATIEEAKEFLKKLMK